MQSYVFQTFSVLIIASFTLIQIPKSFCQDQQYVTCSEPFRCGNLIFGYPFLGGNRPISCGYPGFNLTCQDSVAFLASESVRYRVLAIDGSQQRLTVSRDDIWNDLCPRFIYDTTFNDNIFKYSSGLQNVSLYYDCAVLVPNFTRQPNQFDCQGNSTTTNNSTTSFFYYATTFGFNPTSTDVECSRFISVPVNEAEIQNLVTATALQAALKDGFGIEWEANNSVCDECERSGGRCGYNSSTSSFHCFCSDRPYNQTCGNIRNGSGKSKRRIMGAAVLGLVIPFGTIGLTLSVAGAYYLVKRCSSCEGMIWWRSDRQKHQNVEAFIRSYNGSLAPKCYSFSEIKGMTYSFAHQLGQGGYGSVYKGKLSDGRQVAVKVLKGNKGNGEDFINEVDSISRTSHVNVVTLLGFCYEANKRALVYDFMSNGSLDKFICRNESQGTDCRLEWEVLYKIALGTARGLEYLHQGCNTRIVHFDIKPQNILLDDDFCPKISDFGLAKLCKKKQSILSTMGARGTVGYIAPEVVFREFGGVSHKSDVYSYGMMVLEMVGLKSRIQVDTDKSSETYFPNWIHERLELGKDLGLEGIKNVEEEEAAMKIILVGLWCIQTKPSDRPSMSKVVEMLESSVQSLQLPAKPSLLEYSPAARMDSLVHSLSAAEEAVGGLENGASSGGSTLSGSQAED